MRAIKQPSEKVTFRYQFADDLNGIAIGSVSGVPVSTPRGGGANMTQSGAGTISGTDVLVTWQGGVAGETYATTVKIVDAAGDIHEKDGEILVVEEGFVLPKNLAGRYLTADEYVTRYGQQETVRLTDEDGRGKVDGARLEEALKDASDEADGYIGTRYSTPLIDTPRVVKSIVGALAREKLHKARPMPEVVAAADRARTQLRDISAGRMTLPVDQGASAPVMGGNLYAVTSGDGSTTFRDAVSAFSTEPGAYIPNWRR